MFDLLRGPWPWFVAGPLIGLLVPILLVSGNRLFGFSSNFRHICAAVAPARPSFLTYDWRISGGWNLAFAAGVLIGGFLAANVIGHPAALEIAEATRADLLALGITDTGGFVPTDLFAWSELASPRGFLLLIGGGFLVGFGTAYAGGCTSGHGIAGLANFDRASLVAVIGLFVGGLISTHLLLPLML